MAMRRMKPLGVSRSRILQSERVRDEIELAPRAATRAPMDDPRPAGDVIGGAYF